MQVQPEVGVFSFQTFVVSDKNKCQLDKASFHRNAKIHAGAVFVLCDLDLLTPNELDFRYRVNCGETDRQTDAQTDKRYTFDSRRRG